MTEKTEKKAAFKRAEKYRSLRRLTYINMSFPEGAIFDPKEHNLNDADLENLLAGGDIEALDEGELADLENTNVLRSRQANQTPLDQVDIVIAKVRGEDVAFEDNRVKGPNEPPIGEREPHVTRLPPGDIPSGTPLGVEQAARAMAPKKMKVEKPEPPPPRDENEGGTISKTAEDRKAESDDAAAASHKKAAKK